jgi:hypothetical protein
MRLPQLCFILSLSLPLCAQTNRVAQPCGTENAKVHKLGPSLSPFDAASLSAPTLTEAARYLAEKGMQISTEEGRTRPSCTGGVQGYAFPVRMQNYDLIGSISLRTDAASKSGTKIDAVQYNNRFSAGNVRSTAAWAFFRQDPKNPFVLFVQVVRFDKSLPVVIYSVPGGDSLVVNREAGIMYTASSSDTSSIPANFFSCLLTGLGITGWTGAFSLDDLCTLYGDGKQAFTLFAFVGGLLSCEAASIEVGVDLVADGICVLTVDDIIQFIACPAISLATCPVSS